MAGIDHEALTRARNLAGFTKTQLAESAGISLQYLCDIERGDRRLKRRPDLIKKLAEALGVPPKWLQAEQ